MMTTATKNFRIGLLTLVIAVMATLADPGFVQGESTPGTPGNLTVTVGDTEAKIAWEAPAAGDCAVTEYEVEVHQARELIRASQAMTVTDWTLDGLTANTTYRATVISYGESCDDYSDSAEQNFTTNANSSTSDPVRGTDEAKYVPDPPRNLVITVGDTEAKIAWDAPAADADTCAVTEYEVEVHQARELIHASEATTATEWTLDGLTASTTYRATVISYGESCDDYSDSAEQNFTTNASSGPGDPMRNDNEAKYIQAPPSGVMITRHGTSGIRVAWTQLPTPANTCSPSEYSVRLYKDGTRVGKADEITTTYWDFENAYTADARYTAKIESYSDACNEYSDRAARLSTNVR
ncbi:MAG: fibronectin type III domain-containing protein [Desulfurellaceae bacterium]|nr:fibronectin type III domain-containing protein [Desulfurellaceae bacterium]